MLGPASAQVAASPAGPAKAGEVGTSGHVVVDNCCLLAYGDGVAFVLHAVADLLRSLGH